MVKDIFEFIILLHKEQTKFPGSIFFTNTLQEQLWMGSSSYIRQAFKFLFNFLFEYIGLKVLTWQSELCVVIEYEKSGLSWLLMVRWNFPIGYGIRHPINTHSFKISPWKGCRKRFIRQAWHLISRIIYFLPRGSMTRGKQSIFIYMRYNLFKPQLNYINHHFIFIWIMHSQSSLDSGCDMSSE